MIPKINSNYANRTVWRRWARPSIRSVLFALTVARYLPTLHSTLKTDCRIVKKIGTSCSQPSVCLAGSQSKPATDGSRPSTTTTTANALTALSARRTWRARDFSSRLGNHSAKAMQRCAVRRWPHWIVVPTSVSHKQLVNNILHKSWKKVWKLSWMQNAARPYFAGISWTIRFLYLITYSPLPHNYPSTSPTYLLAFFIFFTLMETLCVLLQTVAICIIRHSLVSNKRPWSSNQFWPVFNTYTWRCDYLLW